MKSRALRLALHALFVVLVGAAAYVVWQQETENLAAANASHAFDERARVVVRSFLEIKGAQPGYVAAGQGEDYWVARVDTLIAGAREGLTALKSLARVPQSQTEIDAALADLEDFEQMDRRAREYVRGGQRLLASDLVFSDGIEKMDGSVSAIDRARLAESTAVQDAIGTRRREQLLTAAGAVALAVLITFMLVPLPRVESAAGATGDAPLVQARAGAPLSIAPPQAPVKPTPSSTAAASVPARTLGPAVASSAPKSSAPGVDLTGIAALCSDLTRVTDTRALPGALERAAALLNASGLVIWIADPDGRELAPVIAHGYPQNLVSRMGTIPRDAENATAAAFRTGLVQVVKADQISQGAIAAPLLSPAGPLGVMAAEMLQDGERRDATRAALSIVAAQFSTLMGPPPARGEKNDKSEAAVRA
jgi:GAF domain-containing protein